MYLINVIQNKMCWFTIYCQISTIIALFSKSNYSKANLNISAKNGTFSRVWPLIVLLLLVVFRYYKKILVKGLYMAEIKQSWLISLITIFFRHAEFLFKFAIFYAHIIFVGMAINTWFFRIIWVHFQILKFHDNNFFKKS